MRHVLAAVRIHYGHVGEQQSAAHGKLLGRARPQAGRATSDSRQDGARRKLYGL